MNYYLVLEIENIDDWENNRPSSFLIFKRKKGDQSASKYY